MEPWPKLAVGFRSIDLVALLMVRLSMSTVGDAAFDIVAVTPRWLPSHPRGESNPLQLPV